MEENKNLPMQLPTAKDLFEQSDNLEVAFKHEALNTLLSVDPNPKWIKVHPFIKGYNYLPIDKVEFLLRKIFKRYRIEVLREGVAFNGVYVVVRVWYFNPSSSEMEYHDGIGACQLQTRAGMSAADLANINNGALSMAFPIAKTIAVKDACDHFGNLFGANLNRKDVIPFHTDKALVKQDPVLERMKKMIGDCKTFDELNMLRESHPDVDVKLFDAQNEVIKSNKK